MEENEAEIYKEVKFNIIKVTMRIMKIEDIP